MNPKWIIPTSYRFLSLGFGKDRRSKEHEMALYECLKAMHHDLYFDVFMDEDYKTKVKSVNPSSIDDMLKEIKPLIDIDDNNDICQLERYSLDREINAAAVAKRIVTEAGRIFEEQKRIGKMCRKERSERTAEARQKPALVFDTPTPTN
jgi:hypothetical protein